jgi:hypothetical protein
MMNYNKRFFLKNSRLIEDAKKNNQEPRTTPTTPQNKGYQEGGSEFPYRSLWR